MNAFCAALALLPQLELSELWMLEGLLQMDLTSLGFSEVLRAAIRQAGGDAATCAASMKRATAVLSLANMLAGVLRIINRIEGKTLKCWFEDGLGANDSWKECAAWRDAGSEIGEIQ